MLRKKRIRDILQTPPQSSTPNTKFNLSIKDVANENWFLNPRPPASSPPAPHLHDGNNAQSVPVTNFRVGHTLKRGAPAPVLDRPRERITHSEIYPAGRASSDHSRQTIWEHWAIRACKILHLTPIGGRAAGVGVRELSIPWEILTPGETRIRDGILTIIRISIRIIVQARILTGTTMPPRILTRLTLVRTLTRILILARILMLTRIPTRILAPSRIITVIPILFRTLNRILMLDGNLGPEEILALDSTLVSEEIETSTRIQTY